MRNLRTKFSKKNKIILGITLVILGILFVFQFNSFFNAHQTDVPAKGGIFTDTVIGKVHNFNPLSNDITLIDRDIHSLLYAGLLRFNPLTSQIEPGLADFVISEDLKTYTLTLKNSAKFSNGDNVTTDDVIFTFEKVVKNPGFQNKSLQSAFEYVTIDVIDEKRVQFTIPEQNVFFSSLLTTPILQEKGFQDAFIQEITDPDYPANKRPIGAGPFKFKNFIPNNDGSFRLFLQSNPHYYQNKPYIDQYVLYGFPSTEHLQANHTWTTFFSHLSSSFADKFQTKEKLDERYAVEQYKLPRWIGMFYNMEKDYTGRVDFRRALNLSINKDQILESSWEKVNSPFFYEGLTEIHNADYSKARTLLRDNGFPYDTENETRAFGTEKVPVEITMITTIQPASYSRMAQKIARVWEEELGITVNVEILSDLDFKKALQEGNYDTVFYGQNFSYNFDSLSLWHSSQKELLNISKLANDRIDILIYQVQISGSRTDMIELNESLSERVPMTILGTPKYDVLYSQELRGITKPIGQIRTHDQRYFGIHKWYFYTEKDWDLPSNTSYIGGFFKWIFSGKKSLNNTIPKNEDLLEVKLDFNPEIAENEEPKETENL